MQGVSMGFGGGAIPQKLMRQDQARRNARRRDPTARRSPWEPDAEVGPLLGESDDDASLERILKDATRADLMRSALGVAASLACTTGLFAIWLQAPDFALILLLGLPLCALLAGLAGSAGSRASRRAAGDPEQLWRHRAGRWLSRAGATIGSTLLLVFLIGAPWTVATLY